MGIIPPINQEPDNAPIKSKIIIALEVDFILFDIDLKISSQLIFLFNAMKHASAADKRRAIWLGPEMESFPNSNTFIDNNIINKIIGEKDWSKLILFNYPLPLFDSNHIRNHIRNHNHNHIHIYFH